MKKKKRTEKGPWFNVSRRTMEYSPTELYSVSVLPSEVIKRSMYSLVVSRVCKKKKNEKQQKK